MRLRITCQAALVAVVLLCACSGSDFPGIDSTDPDSIVNPKPPTPGGEPDPGEETGEPGEPGESGEPGEPDPDKITLEIYSFPVSADNSVLEIHFSVNTVWSAEVDPENKAWYSIEPASGIAGNVTLQIVCKANDTFREREAKITITAGTDTETITITQPPLRFFSIESPKNYSFWGENETIEVIIIGNPEISATISPSASAWISPVGITTENEKTIYKYSIARRNDNEIFRTGEILFSMDGQSEPIAITQGSTAYTYVDIKAGESIASKLTSAQIANTTRLVIMGEAEIVDFETMRDRMPQLEYINMERSGVKSIPDKAFYLGNGIENANMTLTEVVFPKNLISIEESAFRNCEAITTLEFPETLISIGADCFLFCNALVSVHMNPGLTTIGPQSFSGCSNLVNVNFPEKLKILDRFIFADCYSLETIELPEELTHIGLGCFSGCKKLKSIKVPSKVVKIDREAFQACYELCEIDLPASVESIGYGAFGGCQKLSTVISRRTSPPVIIDNTFEYISDAPRLYVPQAAVNNYKESTYWNEAFGPGISAIP